MNAVCKKYTDAVRPYSTKVLLMITIPFLICGLLLLLTYSYLFIRYGIIVIFMIIVILYRKKVGSVLKHIFIEKR